MNQQSSLPDVLLQSFLKASRLPACICNREGGIVDANQAFQALCQVQQFGETTHLGELFKAVDGSNPDDCCTRLGAGSCELPVYLAEQTGEPAQIIAHFASIEEKPGFVTVLFESRTRDVDWQQRLGTVVQVISDAVFVCDEQMHILYVNDAARDLTGYKKKALRELRYTDLDAELPTLEAGMLEQLAVTGERKAFTTAHLTRADLLIPVQVSLNVEKQNDSLVLYLVVRDLTEQLRHSRFTDELEFVIENSSDAIYLYDASGQIEYVNEVACRQLGYSREDLLAMNISQIDQSFSQEKNLARRAIDEGGAAKSIETIHKKRDGTQFPVRLIASSCQLNNKVTAVAFARDISDQLAVQKALMAEEERFRVIADTSPVALVICDYRTRRLQYANEQAETLFGLKRKVLMGKDVNALFSEPLVTGESMPEDSTGRVVVNREISLKPWSRHNVWASVNASIVRLRDDKVICLALLDITESRELSIQLSYQASYDDLTGLLNRREFNNRLQACIEGFSRTEKPGAVCYLDLDQFKVINDTCGHPAGDALLQQIARILKDSVRTQDVLARLGGDEFAILLENCSLENAETVAEKIRSNLERFRFSQDGRSFNVTASIGVVGISADSLDLTEIMRQADNACYMAKEGGRNRLYLLRSGDVDHSQREGEMRWVTRITEAMDNDTLMLWVQHINSATDPYNWSGRAEVLLRMRGEKEDIILPGTFLPVAERYALANRVDRWVVNRLFTWLSANPEALRTYTSLAINLSGHSLDDEEFLQTLLFLIERLGIPASKLCFEITETAAISNLNRAVKFMRTLQGLGAKFSLDDFGSGLSSFGYLKRMPVDFVKIDGQFVRDILNDPVDMALVKSINDMAHAMGKSTVAEFVESAEILQAVAEIGVDYVQGWEIARPVPLET